MKGGPSLLLAKTVLYDRLEPLKTIFCHNSVKSNVDNANYPIMMHLLFHGRDHLQLSPEAYLGCSKRDQV